MERKWQRQRCMSDILKYHLMMLTLFILGGPLLKLTSATHFRGGLISCGPDFNRTSTGIDQDGNAQVKCDFRIGWRRNFRSGTYCNSTDIARKRLLRGEFYSRLYCVEGCGTTGVLVDGLSYYCTGFSDTENWSQGTRSFVFNATGVPARISFWVQRCCWINGLVDRSPRGRIQWGTSFTLSIRADTGRLNSSPRSALLPIIRVPAGCSQNISIHTEDPDGDIVRCRWASPNASTYDECGGVCGTSGNLTLRQEPCELELPSNLAPGLHGFAVTLEDFLRSDPMGPPLSSVPLQFLLEVFGNSSDSCVSRPTIVTPSPEDNTCHPISPGAVFSATLRVQQTTQQSIIRSVGLTAPAGMQRGALVTGLQVDKSYFSQITVTWSPTAEEFGQHIFCFLATDWQNITSTQRCVTLLAGANTPDLVPGTMTPSVSKATTAPYRFGVFTVDFDQQIFKPTTPVPAIRIHEINGSFSSEIYALAAATSSDVEIQDHPTVQNHYQLTFFVSIRLKIGATYSISLDPGVVRGSQSCTGGGVPFVGLTGATDWQFVTDHTVGNISDCQRNFSQLLSHGPIQGDRPLVLGNGSSCETLPIPLNANGFPLWGRSHETLTICENGLAMLDQPHPILHPQLFPGDWAQQPAIFAPYWCLADNGHSQTLPDGIRSHVWYNQYQRPSSSDLTVLEAVDSLVIAKQRSLDLSFRFASTWAIVVTWQRITPFPSLYQYQVHNTFQAVLTTDGLRSFAIYAYDANSIQWSSPLVYDVYARFDHAVVGYTSPSHSYNDPRSGTDVIKRIDTQHLAGSQHALKQSCAEGSLYIFKLYTSVDVTGSRAQCLSWYASQPDPATWTHRLPPCPCLLGQAQADSRFHILSSNQSLLCFQSVVPIAGGSSVKCCYRNQLPGRGAFLDGPPDGGHAVRFSALSHEPVIVASEESQPLVWCCQNETTLCPLFWEKRPSVSCAGYTPPVLGLVAVPVVSTLAGESFAFNSVDTQDVFLVAEVKDIFRVEAMVSQGSSFGSASLTEVGIHANGSDTVRVSVVNGTSLSFFVNGVPLTDRVLKVLSDHDENITLECLQWTSNCREVGNMSRESTSQAPAGVSVHRNVNIVIQNSTHASVVFATGLVVDFTLDESTGSIAVATGIPPLYTSRTDGLLQANISGTSSNGSLILPRKELQKFILGENATLIRGIQKSNITSTPSTPQSPSAAPLPNSDKYEMELNATCGQDRLCHSIAAIVGDLNATKSIIEQIAKGRQRDTQLSSSPPILSTNMPVFSSSSSGSVAIDLSNITIQDTTHAILFIQPETAALSLLTSTPNTTNFFTFAINRNLPASDIQFVVTGPSESAVLIRPVINICDCSNNGTCNETLLSPLSSSRTRIFACQCSDAYDGSYCERDRDGCRAAYQPCSAIVNCTDVPAPGTGYQCGKCPTGFSGKGGSCYDIDECCSTCSSPCQQLCVNTQGGYRCECNTGYHLGSDLSSCTDIDECTDLTHDCDQRCANTNGSYTCQCYSGFVLNATGHCLPTDTCVNPGTCQQLCSRNKTTSSDTCACKSGFVIDPAAVSNCTDIDECSSTASPCPHSCANTPGSYRCSCDTGFQLAKDQRTCNDINECVEKWPACQGDQQCFNTLGSFQCSCRPGYRLSSDNQSCQAITCEKPNNPGNGALAGGSWSHGAVIVYSCNVGYRLNGTSTRQCTVSGSWSNPAPACNIITCPDLTLPAHSVSSPASNTFGSIRTFQCEDGYRLAGQPTVQCTSNGVWIPSIPRCEIVHCHSLGDVNVTLSSNRTEYGTSISVMCMPGLREVPSTGNRTLQCLSSGSWSSPLLQCLDCACDKNRSWTTVCNSTTAQCICKRGASGQRCDSCMSGYYHVANVGCVPCNCSGRSSVCTPTNNSKDAGAIEVRCDCPAEYSGLRCEHCALGYSLANTSSAVFSDGNVTVARCVPCQCNGRSNSCHPVSGVCQNCSNNTTGRQCEKCAIGYTLFTGQDMDSSGSGDTCVPCLCHNNAITCHPSTGVCVNCSGNTAGDACEKCALGYYGRGLPNQGCLPCTCDERGSANSSCDIMTGACPCRHSGVIGRQCDSCAQDRYKFPTCLSCGCDSQGSIHDNCSSSGNCQCHPNVGGIKCDECITGHFNFPTCSACNCHVAGSTNSTICDVTTGQCGCQPNVGGAKCDECSSGHFNFPTCSACNCDVAGSANSSICDVTTGQCGCQPNVGGIKCDECSSGHFNFPTCSACNCDVAGSANSSICDATTGQCGCQPNVGGAKCDECSSGHFNFPTCSACNCDVAGSANSSICDVTTGQCGCQPNVGGAKCDECSSGHFNFPTCSACNCDVAGSTNSTICDATTGQCGCQPNVGGAKCDECSSGHFNFPTCSACNCHVAGSANSTICDVTTGQCGCQPNVGGAKCDECSSGHFNFPTCSACNCDVAGSANSTICDVTTGQCGCRPNVGGIKCDECITGHFNFPTCSACNCHVAGSANSTICDATTGQCGCQPNVGGAKCDECSSGHFNFPTCSACNCHVAGSANSTICDATTGQCGCQPNVGGIKCDECSSGHFNFPTCSACNCDVAGSTNSTICDATTGQCGCQPNVGGIKCDECSSGHFNFPTCSACNCDVAGSANSSICDVTTGQCGCQPNVGGAKCDECSSGHFNFPTCSACNCDVAGSTNSTICDATTGQCGCQPNVGGAKCDECSSGHFNFPTCSACNCDVAGSANSTICDVTTGQCGCRPNVGGIKCDECITGHFNFPTCSACNCHVAGSANSTICDVTTGQCGCQPNVGGIKCDECSSGHFNFPTCSACNCDVAGSANSTICDVTTGQCGCQPNVGGIKCDECSSGHFNFPTCSACNCHVAGSANSTICDATTGQCGCQPNVGGAKCDECSSGHFNFPTCSACNCDVAGSTNSTICDATTGQCGCQPNVGGAKCDECSSGHFNFPTCSACNCDVAGSANSTICDVTTGQCGCQPNVGGIKCDECITGHFNFPTCSACNCDVAGSTNSTICDVTTGQCGCQPNVDGAKCDKCIIGHFSFPTCSACNCDVAGSTISTICDATTGQCGCQPNVGGAKCDECSSGHFNFPTCSACNCDVAGSTNSTICDATTGQCGCQPNVGGAKCDECSSGHFNFPTCSACNCHVTGSANSSICDATTGQCECLEYAAGQKCDQCATGYYRSSSGAECTMCSCDNSGTEPGTTCDSSTGKCVCRSNFAGDNCEICQPKHYGHPKCLSCSCSETGSKQSDICNITSGQCDCREGVSGKTCDRCADGNFGFGSAAGCRPCDCNKEGTDSCVDNGVSGFCMCKNGSRGTSCETCTRPGYYRSEDLLDPCTGIDGSYCHACCCYLPNTEGGRDQCSATGYCTCLLGSTGKQCRDCIEDYHRNYTDDTSQCKPLRTDESTKDETAPDFTLFIIIPILLLAFLGLFVVIWREKKKRRKRQMSITPASESDGVDSESRSSMTELEAFVPSNGAAILSEKRAGLFQTQEKEPLLEGSESSIERVNVGLTPPRPTSADVSLSSHAAEQNMEQSIIRRDETTISYHGSMTLLDSKSGVSQDNGGDIPVILPPGTITDVSHSIYPETETAKEQSSAGGDASKPQIGDAPTSLQNNGEAMSHSLAPLNQEYKTSVGSAEFEIVLNPSVPTSSDTASPLGIGERSNLANVEEEEDTSNPLPVEYREKLPGPSLQRRIGRQHHGSPRIDRRVSSNILLGLDGQQEGAGGYDFGSNARHASAGGSEHAQASAASASTLPALSSRTLEQKPLKHREPKPPAARQGSVKKKKKSKPKQKHSKEEQMLDNLLYEEHASAV